MGPNLVPRQNSNFSWLSGMLTSIPTNIISKFHILIWDIPKVSSTHPDWHAGYGFWIICFSLYSCGEQPVAFLKKRVKEDAVS